MVILCCFFQRWFHKCCQIVELLTLPSEDIVILVGLTAAAIIGQKRDLDAKMSACIGRIGQWMQEVVHDLQSAASPSPMGTGVCVITNVDCAHSGNSFLKIFRRFKAEYETRQESDAAGSWTAQVTSAMGDDGVKPFAYFRL